MIITRIITRKKYDVVLFFVQVECRTSQPEMLRKLQEVMK